MLVYRVLGRSTTSFVLWLSLGGALVACGSRDRIIGGPFGGEDDEATGGSSRGLGGKGHSTGGGAGSSNSVGGSGGSAGSSSGGTFPTGGAATNVGGDTGFGGASAGASGTSTGGDAGSFIGAGGVFEVGGSSVGGDAAGGAAAATGGASGGSSTGGSSTGGSSTGGSSTGGSSTGGSTAGSGLGGSSGNGGTAGSGGIGHLGDPCSPNGALACHGAAQRLRVLCDGNVWQTNGTCVESENCDARSGVCATIVSECVGKRPSQRVCRSNQLEQCGPDLVTYDALQDCSGRCVQTDSSADCAPERCGDGRVETGEACDDGNSDDTDQCTNACNRAVCGDGSLYADLEKCDDGNSSAGDSCSVVCGSDALLVGTGYYHTCGLGKSGRIQCWGYNQSGQLGTGDSASRGSWINDMGVRLPLVDLGSGKLAISLSVGYQSSCAVLSDGSVKCWGYNYYGQLGVGDTATRGTAPNHMGENLPSVSLGSGRRAQRVYAGALHTCALLDDRSVKCWGSNMYAQLGQGDIEDRGDVAGELGDNLPAIDLGSGPKPTMISTGYYHNCALLENGQVKCWGSNMYGQLGQGDVNARGAAPNEMGDNLPSVDLGSGRTAVMIAASETHNCAVLDNGMVKCWGGNSYGQLGQGDTLMRGGAPGEMGDALLPVDLGPGRSAKWIATGSYNSCAVLDNDQVKCWGYNGYGALGIGDTNTHGDGQNEMGSYLPQVNLGTGRSARAISVGAMHVCALLDNLAIKCWGGNSYAQLGVGSTTNLGDGAGELGDSLPYVFATF